MPLDEKTGKWIDSECYLKAMGQSDCDGHIRLVDVELVPERVLNHAYEGGENIKQISRAHLRRIFACDKCGFVYEKEDETKPEWVPA